MATVAELMEALEKTGEVTLKPNKAVILIRCFFGFLLGTFLLFGSLFYLQGYLYFNQTNKLILALFILNSLFAIYFLLFTTIELIRSGFGPSGTLIVNKNGITLNKYFNQLTWAWDEVKSFSIGSGYYGWPKGLFLVKTNGSSLIISHNYPEAPLLILAELFNECKKRYA